MRVLVRDMPSELKISACFKKEFVAIRRKAEKANFFKQKLFLNYLYKETGILKAVKNDFNKHQLLYYQLFYLINDKATLAHITTDLGQIDFIGQSVPNPKITTFNSNEQHRAISKASYINNKFKIRYVDAVAEVWQRNTVLVLSHLNSFTEDVPAHIREIIVVCCSFNPTFDDFTLSEDKMGVKIFQRVN